MTKNSSKMTLYEVTSKVAKANKVKAPRVEETPQRVPKPEKINRKPLVPAVMPQKGRQKKPLLASYKKRMHLFARPYAVLAIALGLILVVWIMAANNDPAVENDPVGNENPASEAETVPEGSIQELANSEPIREVSDPVLNVQAAAPSEPVGDHVIILAHYIKMDQLMPVKEYFAENGFETVIDKSGAQYVLMTKNRFQNPGNVGTDGSVELQKLKLAGAKYKAPKGFLGFKFDDIYGKKID